MPANWRRALVVMAHPDDPEYGVAAAVAEWTAAGREVSYLLATRGEAGIAGLPPAQSGPLREAEQRRAAAQVGVSGVDFLEYPDGRLQESPALRRDIARAIRIHRPDGVVTLNHRDTWGPGAWNSQDHQVLGRSVLNAVADAANEWIFPELAAEGLAPHTVAWTAVSSPWPTHAVTVSPESLERAVRSLMAHERYLRALADIPVEEQARRQVDLVTGGGESPRVGFELYGYELLEG
ncbi:PIG-L family deacetylase [Arthrobacter ginkgonis]|uniref:PIG-L family deacetylase n=1 Tax=Arthrobacter ginkgonis TaxID=1630594 RepID=A0ABP7CHU1_9MICC